LSEATLKRLFKRALVERSMSSANCCTTCLLRF
jgi:hypothetical protein